MAVVEGFDQGFPSHHTLANAVVDQGRISGAVPIFESALDGLHDDAAFDSSPSEVLLIRKTVINLITCYNKQKDIEKAIETGETGLVLLPGDKNIFDGLKHLGSRVNPHRRPIVIKKDCMTAMYT